MPSPYTAFQLKEFVIEWSALGVPDGQFVADVSPLNLNTMASLDPSVVDSTNIGVSIYVGPDLASGLLSGAIDLETETWIYAVLMNGLRDEEVTKKVGRLLDEDLNAAGPPYTKLLGPDIKFSSKGAGVASYRVRKNLVRMKEPSSSDGGFRGSDFTVYLTRLANGHDGSIQQTPLYFTFSQSFHHFLRALQEESQLCTIPSLEVTQPTTMPRGWSPEQSSSLYRRGTDTTSSESTSSSQSSWSPSTLVVASPFSQPPTSRLRSPRRKGYTLDDGPWIYRIRAKSQNQWGPYCAITDERSYHTMVDILIDAKKKTPDMEHIAMLIHSMEKEARAKWDEKAYQEGREEREFVRRCEEMDSFDDGDEDKAGVPYLDWLMKSLQNGEM